MKTDIQYQMNAEKPDDVLADLESKSGCASVNGSAPSWDDFCARLLKEAPQLKPDPNDQQWSNLYGIYQMGYEACLEQMKSLLQEEQNVGANPTGGVK